MERPEFGDDGDVAPGLDEEEDDGAACFACWSIGDVEEEDGRRQSDGASDTAMERTRLDEWCISRAECSGLLTAATGNQQRYS